MGKKNFLEHPISSKSWSGLALSNVAASAAMLPITLYALLLWLAWTSGFESHEQRNVKLRKFEGNLHDIWNSSKLIVLLAKLQSILIKVLFCGFRMDTTVLQTYVTFVEMIDNNWRSCYVHQAVLQSLCNKDFGKEQ